MGKRECGYKQADGDKQYAQHAQYNQRDVRRVWTGQDHPSGPDQQAKEQQRAYVVPAYHSVVR